MTEQLSALADALEAANARAGEGDPQAPFQARVAPWMDACFGPEISADKLERNDRFIEEALELVQASGYTAARAHELVNYTFNRPLGEINQEVGGVMVTLAAHCLAHGVDMHEAGETELARIWTKVEQIREKQKAKPRGSALPIAPPLVKPHGDHLPDVGELIGGDWMTVPRSVVVMCAATFRDYEQLHRAKGTPEADEKADANAAKAGQVEQAIAATLTQTGPAMWRALDDNGLSVLMVNGQRITSFPSYPAAQESADRINAALLTLKTKGAAE